MSTEAIIHFELYRHLKNSIQQGIEYHGIKFTSVRPEVKVNSGFADIVIYVENRRPFLVIEAKRKMKGGYKRDLDPYSPKVIEQAFGYASKIGANYFATYNGDTLVLFHTFEEGTHLLERKTSAYLVKNISEFAPSLLKEVAGLEKGIRKWDPRHQAFIKRLKGFHNRLILKNKHGIYEKLEANIQFKKNFEEWIKNQGWDFTNFAESLMRFNTQWAYLLMNKLVFYKIIEDQPAYEKIPKLTIEETDDFANSLKEKFMELINKIDFEVVYEHDPIFDEVPFNDEVVFEIKEFLEELEQYDLSQFDHDVVGKIYESIIPIKERHDLGQYYTPKEVVDLITKLTILDANDRLLDPGCGSGSFLVGAYERLKVINKKEKIIKTHNELLNQLYGIDINRFPIHLTAINLALRDLNSNTKSLNLEVQDYFNLNPKQNRIVVELATISGIKKVTDSTKLNVPTKVNVIIGNPPYIRQEKIANKELCRRHLKRIGYKKFSNRSDIYVYFFTHSSEFLDNNGRLGFITSNKWLTTRYGEDLQDFFLNTFKIQAVIEFSKSVFEDALVPTCITLLTKCEEKEKRNENIVKFIRIKRKMKLDEIVSRVSEKSEPETLLENNQIRILSKSQKDLYRERKWDKFIYAPNIYWDIISRSDMIELKEIVTISRRITSGCNDFFYIEEAEYKKWGINMKFLRPIAKSIRQTETISFRKSNSKFMVLDLNNYIYKKLKNFTEKDLQIIKLPDLPSNANLKDLTNLERYILKCLYDDGYQGTYTYIIHNMWERDWGSHKLPHLRPTCIANRKRYQCWFNLGELSIPDMFIPETCWERIFVPVNLDGIVADRNLYDINLKEDIDRDVIAGILNSNYFKLVREIEGRTTGGGASRVVIYEVETMKIPDPSKLSEDQKQNIKMRFRELQDVPINTDEYDVKLKNLDKAVLSGLNSEELVDELSEVVIKISNARRKGVDPEILLDDGKRVKKRKLYLKGAKKVYEKSQKSLLDF